VLLALALILQDTLPGRTYPGRGAPAVDLPRVEATAAVDGVLDEPVWAQAARLTGFSQYQPVDGRDAEERTEVRVWYAPDAIWFGIIAYDREPGSVRATVADRDRLGTDDNVRIYLDTFNDQRRAYFFGVNPLGSQEDGVRTEGASSAGNIFGGNNDLTPDLIWQSKGRLTPEGYVVEIRIPFKSLRYSAGDTKQWGIQVVRQVRRTGYEDTWTDARRASASFLIQSGKLAGMDGIRRGVVTEVQPVLTSATNGTLDGTTGEFSRSDPTSDIGVNLRLGFTSVTVDGTYNPDFSQVEADAGQVTLNQRFALFFPERRQFFLEGIELFSTPNQLVYTRTVADPHGGLKVTGKVGGTTIAYLGAVDRVPEGKDAVVNIARLRQDLGTNSYVGLTYTDRTAGPAYNRVVAADVRYVFGGMYYAAVQLGSSATDNDDGAGRLSSPIWQAEVDRTGRAWGFNYKVVGIGENFTASSGFVNRNNVVNAQAFNRFTLYGERGAFFENITTFFGPRWIWDYAAFDAGDAIEGSMEATVQARLRGGWNVSLEGATSFVEYDPAAYAGYTNDAGSGVQPFLPVEQYDDGRELSLSASTPTFQKFDAELDVATGNSAIFAEASNGYYWSAEAEVNFRPLPSIRLGVTTQYATLWRERDGSQFGREVIPRLRVEFQPNRWLFFRFVGQYTSQQQAALEGPTGTPMLEGGVPIPADENNGLRMDLLGSYEPSPGTVVFLGYGTSLAGEKTLTFKELERTQDGFFLKLAYLFRR
jgi:hypothetical protein